MNKKDLFWIEFIANSKPKLHYKFYPYCLYLLNRNGLECPVKGLDRMDWALATAKTLAAQAE